MKLAIIPARGGSKRIPRKNIKPFAGKPMIAWSIESALASGCFDRIIVSTDDPEIANVARAYGAEVPFMRPPELSDDHAGTMPVISHAIDWQNTYGEAVENACCIYATAPFLQASDIQQGLLKLDESDAKYVFSVCQYQFPIQRAIKVKANHRVEMFYEEYMNSRSQDLDIAYHDAGQFYWGKASAWLKSEPVFSENSSVLILPRYRVQDIDDLEDWMQAELMHMASLSMNMDAKISNESRI